MTTTTIFQSDPRILILTYKALHDMSPKYICELLNVYKTKLSLKYQRQRQPRMANTTYSAAAPCLWNRLPEQTKQAPDLNSFKKLLKSYLIN